MVINVTDEMINIYENNVENQGIKLAKFVAKKYCDFNEVELEFIDKFWNPAFNNKWMYLSKQMIMDDFGYTDGSNMISHFYQRILYTKFKINVDYSEVAKDSIVHPELDNQKVYTKGGTNKKYYVISGYTYKTILMLIKTSKGDQIRNYYIKVEDLASKTYYIINDIKNKIIIDKLQKDFDEKLKIEKDKNVKLSKFIDRYNELQKK